MLQLRDLQAFLALAQDRTGLEAVLTGMTTPCCLYLGEADPLFSEAKLATDIIPHARFFSLPGLSHLEAFVRSDLIPPRVTMFLRSGTI